MNEEIRNESYMDAFYTISNALGIVGARPCSPKEVLENEILPAIRKLRAVTEKAIFIEAVAEMILDGEGGLRPNWLLEGGSSEFVYGDILYASNEKLTDENGFGEIYLKTVSVQRQDHEANEQSNG